MYLETQRQVPDYGLLWGGLLILKTVKPAALNEDQRKSLEVRDLTKELCFVMESLLSDPQIDTDPDFRTRILEKCGYNAAELIRLGVCPSLRRRSEPVFSGNPLTIARHAASLVMVLDFTSVPSISTVIGEFQAKPGSVTKIDEKISYKVLKDKNPIIERWEFVQSQIDQARRILSLSVK